MGDAVMNRAIWMADGEPACRPTACYQMNACARRDISADGRPLVDFSRQTVHGFPQCCAPMWLKRVLPANAVKPTAPPGIKEWIGS